MMQINYNRIIFITLNCSVYQCYKNTIFFKHVYMINKTKFFFDFISPYKPYLYKYIIHNNNF